MAGNSGSAYDQITIQQQTFKVPIRYAAGHTLTEGEAGALNQTFHENLRNNFAKKVTEGIDAGVGLDVLQQQLDDYAAEYKFGERSGGGGFRGDPVMQLAMNAARELVRKAVKDKKFNEEEWPASRISSAAKTLIESQGDDGLIIVAARKQHEAEKAVAQTNYAEALEVVSQAG